MSSIFITGIIGTGIYDVPESDSALNAASSGFNTILSGVAGLSVGNVSAWVTTGSGAIPRQLNCALNNVTWLGEICPDNIETDVMINAIQSELLSDPDIISFNLQSINIENVPTGPAVPTTHATSHQSGGGDEISVAGLSGLLATAQTSTKTLDTSLGTKIRLLKFTGFNISNYYEGDFIFIRLEMDDDGAATPDIECLVIEASGVKWCLGERMR